MSLTLWIAGFVLGFSIGILTGLFGAGGGFILTPALNIFLGLPMNIAVGTSSLQIVGAASFSLYHGGKERFKGIKVALFIAIGVPIGSYLGGVCVEFFKTMKPIIINSRELVAVNFILLAIFTCLLSFITLWLLIDNFFLKKNKNAEEDEAAHKGLLWNWKIPPCVSFPTITTRQFSVTILVFIGVFMGALSSMLGVGGGVIMMPMLFYIVGQETKAAARTSVMLILLTCIFAAFFHILHGNVDYILAFALIVGAFFGTKSGTAIQRKISGRSIRKYFAFVVLAATLMVIWKILRMVGVL